ncbi:MAG: asparagine synthetase B, partial [Planctomycetota bacterium]
MCGICGVVGEADAGTVERMAKRLRHRGPDSEGVKVFCSPPAVLGHTRLAIIDLSDAAAQPMSTPDGRFHITYNGEVYNFREIRTELEARGYRFRSNSDT